jgi:DNA primase catalytic subunit
MADKQLSEIKIRTMTKLYYANPKIQEAMVEFSKNREVSPRYFEGFGKRPDILIYPSDILGLVQRGATSFHCSEEIWNDPMQLSSEITREQMDEIRKSWDLLIDIDSPYLDISKEAAKLVIETLEKYGIKNYGLKFSGNKGFHIIVSGEAFPREYEGKKMKESFPEWPRAITEFLFHEIKPEFRKRVGKIMSFSSLEKDKEVIRIYCKQCNNVASKGKLMKLSCPVCGLNMERRDVKNSNRRLRCLNSNCAGVLEVIESKEYYFCEKCMDIENDKHHLSSNKYPELFEEIRGELADEHAELDLVLVAPRHLFRMPYSLHEKTALVSAVMTKNEIDGFLPKDAFPLKVKVLNFMPTNTENEAEKLLNAAMNWKKTVSKNEDKFDSTKYKSPIKYEKIDTSKLDENMFPNSIKKLLKGLNDGKKRGLFVLLTFLRTLNYNPEQIYTKIIEWNKLNVPPLKEGYVKSQIDWHLKQKKNILPPNYENDAFYRDIGIIDKKPDVKNPIVEVLRELRKKS